MKKQGQMMMAVVGVLALIAILGAVWLSTRPATSTGAKTITVDVIHSDGSTKNFTYQTDAEFLGEVLSAEGLIQGEEGPYGMYISHVDGEKAVYEEDNAYWSLLVGEEYAQQGVDLTPIYDGDAFSLVYTLAE